MQCQGHRPKKKIAKTGYLSRPFRVADYCPLKGDERIPIIAPFLKGAGALKEVSEAKGHNVAFGIVLADLRSKAGLSQEKLGSEANLDRSFISLLERGKRSPTLDTMVSLSRVLNVSLTQLISAVEAVLDRK